MGTLSDVFEQLEQETFGRPWMIRRALGQAAQAIEHTRGARAVAKRSAAERRPYATDPWAYFRDVLGYRLTEQQDQVLELIMRYDRVLVPSGTDLGKTFLLGGVAIWFFDAVAALPNEELDLEEQGAQILLPGVDEKAVFSTLYQAMLEHADRAERRGYIMPGRRSENSVLWRVRPRWFVEVLTPPRRIGQQVSHAASGRHHRNQVALIEEGQGVPEALWKAAEGACSSPGNKIISPFNPTEPLGPAYDRARSGSWKVHHLSALEHPNVRARSHVISQAVDFRVIDARVRNECQDRGPYPEVQPDPEFQDFVYAVPPLDAEERGPREDGFPGHPDAPLRVYRPSPSFVAQVLGDWPNVTESGLFKPATWDAAVERWRQGRDPVDPPDRVGVDPAREGSDDTCAAPAWGDTADALLTRFLELQKSAATNGGRAKIDELRATSRARIGTIRVLRKGDGVDVAEQLVSIWGDVPYNVDDTGVGSSPLDHLRRVLELDAVGVTFSSTPPEPLPGMPWCEDMRTWLYVMFARLVDYGLADVPDDPLLRQEVMAHELRWKTRSVEVFDPATKRRVRKRVPSLKLEDKDSVKGKIGRSPDRADAAVLSVYGAPAKRVLAVAAAGVTRASPWRGR